MLCVLLNVHADIFKTFADERVYDRMSLIFKEKFPDDDKKAKCLTSYYRDNKIADDFYTVQLLSNKEMLKEKIQPKFSDAEKHCITIEEHIKSPLGITIIVTSCLLTLLVLIGIIFACRR